MIPHARCFSQFVPQCIVNTSLGVSLATSGGKKAREFALHQQVNTPPTPQLQSHPPPPTDPTKKDASSPPHTLLHLHVHATRHVYALTRLQWHVETGARPSVQIPGTLKYTYRSGDKVYDSFGGKFPIPKIQNPPKTLERGGERRMAGDKREERGLAGRPGGDYV